MNLNFYNRNASTTKAINDIATDGKIYVIVGGQYDVNGYLAYSYDKVNWTEVLLAEQQSHWQILYLKHLGKFVTINSNASVYTSSDGKIWDKITTKINNGVFTDIFYNPNDGVVYCFGMDSSANGYIRKSSNLIDWTTTSYGYATANPTRADNTLLFKGTYIQASFGNTTIAGIRTSSNLTSWTNRFFPTNPMYGLATNGDIVVACGDNGKIATSTDGINWTERVSGISSGLIFCSYYKGYFYTPTNTGKVLRSSDGITWQLLNIHNSITYLFRARPTGNKLFLLGWNGTVFMHTNELHLIKSSNNITTIGGGFELKNLGNINPTSVDFKTHGFDDLYYPLTIPTTKVVLPMENESVVGEGKQFKTVIDVNKFQSVTSIKTK